MSDDTTPPQALPQRITISPDVLFRELAGESVILDLKGEQYYGLDEVGTRFWVLVDEGKSTDEIVAQLLAEYDVDEDTLRQDLVKLVSELVDAGLVSSGEQDGVAGK